MLKISAKPKKPKLLTKLKTHTRIHNNFYQQRELTAITESKQQNKRNKKTIIKNAELFKKQ